MMKQKKIAGIISLCMLMAVSGCQPITETPIVASKKAVAGARIIDDAAVGNVAEQVQVPTSYQTKVMDEHGQLSVSVEADIEVPDTEGVRLKKVETRVFQKKDLELLNRVTMKGGKLTRRVYTDQQKEQGIFSNKDECKKIMADIIASNTSGGDGAELEELLKYWQGMMEAAPDTFETEEVSMEVSYNPNKTEKGEYVENENTVSGDVELDGQLYRFYLNNNWSKDWKKVSAAMSKAEFRELEYTNSYDDTKYEIEWADDRRAVSDYKPDAGKIKKQGEELLQELGFTDMVVADSRISQRFYSFNEVSEALMLHYTRIIEGIPVTYANRRAATWETDVVEEPVIEDFSESLSLTFDEEGLAQMVWENPTEIYDMSDEYVFLLPFSDIKQIFENEVLSENLKYKDDNYDMQIDISKITLGYMCIPDEVSEMEGTLIPVWDFMGTASMFLNEFAVDSGTGMDEMLLNNENQSFLTINAMDGSIIVPPKDGRAGNWMSTM